MAHGDWYFKDWEERTQVQPNGRTKKEYIYTGKYYRIPSPALKNKLLHLVLFLAFFICMVWLNLLPISRETIRHSRALALLALAPGIFWGIGVFNLCFAPAQMTYRHYHQSFRRMKIACPLALACTLISLVLTIYDAVKISITGIPLLFWLLLILALAAAICAWILILLCPCRLESQSK